MLQKRPEYEDEPLDRTGEMAAYETARSAGESSPKDEKKDDERVSLFWRLFGGTILSIVALVSITLFNNMSSSISELRAAISHEREARAELVKKDEYNARITAQYERMRGIDSLKVELEGMKEKVSATTAATAGLKKETTAAVDGVKREVATTTDSMRKDLAALEVLKERVAALTADLKTARDDVTKVSGEVERNKTSDLERKTLRDVQAKQIEESLKELQKGLQDCREKLARLEGAKPSPSDSKPLPKADEK